MNGFRVPEIPSSFSTSASAAVTAAISASLNFEPSAFCNTAWPEPREASGKFFFSWSITT